MLSLPAFPADPDCRFRPMTLRFLGTLFTGLLTLASASTPLAAPVPLDRVLVIVNDDAVTESELNRAMASARDQIRQRGIKMPDDILRKQILERLIINQVQLQLAERRKIHISEQELDQAIEHMARERKQDTATLFAELSKQGIDPAQYRDSLREDLLVQKLVEQHLRNLVKVSPSEVDHFLETRRRLMGGQDAFNVSHIMIPVPETASAEAIAAARKQADAVLARLRAGASFKDVAAAYSRDEKALEGGALGWRTAAQLPELFLKTLIPLKEGDTSEPVRSPNGFHILKLHERRSSSTHKTVTQTRVRHILVRTHKLLPEQDALKKIRELRHRLEAGEDFAAVARAHSDDPVSAAEGGTMGWSSPGQFVPTFERAMDKLAINAISEPVKSPFGYHLIQVLERRQQDIGEDLDRAEAGKQIYARKREEQLQQWVRQLRDEAYVNYLVEGDRAQ